MSTTTKDTRVGRVWKKRGRTPIEATHEKRYVEVQRTSKKGLKYKSYKKIIFKKK